VLGLWAVFYGHKDVFYNSAEKLDELKERPSLQ
jgi:hypothetical protein